MIRAGAVVFPQPSVTKIGGVTGFAATLLLAEAAGLTCMPHSPYLGPGYFATLHLLAVAPGEPLFEVLYVEPAKWVARLRATAPDRRPEVLLKTEMSAGHGGVSGRYQAWARRAFTLAWVLDRLDRLDGA